jgi:hypothetical protein
MTWVSAEVSAVPAVQSLNAKEMKLEHPFDSSLVHVCNG